MRIRPLVATFGLLAVAAWSPSSNSATARDLFGQPGNVQIAIGATPAETWKAATVGAKFEYGPATPGQLPMMKRAPSKVTFVGPVPGSNNTLFETDLAPNVTRIEPLTLSFEVVENVNAGLVSYVPGRAKSVEASFTLGAPSAAISDWVKATLDGKPTSRDVTIKMKNLRGEALRTILLQRCAPTTYTSSGVMSVISLRAAASQVKAAASRVPLFEWVGTSLAGSPSRRDLKLSFLDGGGRALSAPVLKDSLLTEVTWTALDAQDGNLVNESITVQPNQIAPMP